MSTANLLATYLNISEPFKVGGLFFSVPDADVAGVVRFVAQVIERLYVEINALPVMVAYFSKR